MFLRYKAKLNKETLDYNEIFYDSLYLSPNLNFISGVTDTSYGLVNNQTIMLYMNDFDGYRPYPIKIKHVKQQGYVIYNQEFKVKNQTVRYIDGLTYKADENNTIVINKKKITGVTTTKSSVTIPTRYYVYDGGIEIDGILYTVDFYSDDPSIILRDNTKLLVQNHTNEKQKVQFIIQKKDNVKLKIDHIHCTRWEEDINTWVNVNNADKMHLYSDSTHYNLQGGQVILATPIVAQNVFLPLLNSEYVIYHGNKYVKSKNQKKFAVLGDKEYEILTIDNVNYFVHDGVTVNIKIDDSGWKTDYTYGTMTKGQGTIKEYDYVTINDIDYLLKEEKLPKTVSGTASNITGTMVYDDQPLRLMVEETTSNNCLRCSLICDFDSSGWVQYLIANQHNYNFEIYSSLFNEGDIEPYTYTERAYITSTYRLFDPIQKIAVPILARQQVGINVHQEDILNSQFVEVEKQKSINPIIDMEKDIYYPYYHFVEYVDENTKIDKYKMIDEIQIDLHFRSRDLETWKINEDVSDEDSTNNNISVVNSSWNIFDYYNWDSSDVKDKLKPIVTTSNCNYYQPSDLLYFLNFTDNDVFYQKKKIEKSFLRLSFYSSKNPQDQVLLHTSTIFMNENGLYKTYTDNSLGNGLYTSVNEVYNETERIINMSNIRVNYELQEDKFYRSGATTAPTVLFDEKRRLSSRFTIKNRFVSQESSEGFYLYMFRDFSPNLEEKTIYMKVEFNHAGMGRTLNFMQPFNGSGDNKTMLDFSNSDTRNEFKKGYSLEDLYDHLYIEIKCKYNKENRCFMYYLPTWLIEHNTEKNIMKFNLYEVKIKNDSIEPKLTE